MYKVVLISVYSSVLYVCVCVCVCIHIYIYVYMCIYIYTFFFHILFPYRLLQDFE